ncbi:MAG: hypothetical protein GTO62_13095, partial [Planctomycetales bacterium]|nr:hypothetical protein [Planctomycetales bacterium]
MNLNQRERFLLYLTIAVGVLMVSWLVLVPMGRSYRALGDERHVLQRQLDEYRATVERTTGWQQEYQALRVGLGQRIEKYEQMSEVLRKIEEVAGMAGVIVSSRRPLPENDRGVFIEFPVQFRLEATTESLVRFLFALRTGSGFVSVQK